MTRIRRCPAFYLALFAGTVPGLSAQQTTATAYVTYEVTEINEISISGDPGPLVVEHAVAGDGLSVAIDEGTTWTLATNGSGKKITAFLDAGMPAGVSLAVALAAPEGASTAGAVALSPTPQTLVSQVAKVRGEGLRVTYTLSATPQAGTVARDRRSVTFTIVADS